MQEVYFEKEGMNHYMVLMNAKDVVEDSYANTLLTVVEVPSFMNYEIREMNGVQNIYYKLKFRTSLKQVLGDWTLTRRRLEYMLQSIVDVLRHAEEYLLCQENILWNSSHIFIEVNTGKMLFTYYPGEKQNENGLQSFLMELIQYVDKGQHAYLYVMEFYNAVTNPDCTIERLQRCVNGGIGEENSFMESEKISYREKNDDRKNTFDKDVDERMNSKKIVYDRKKAPAFSSMVYIAILVLINIGVVLCLLFGLWSYQYIWILVVTLTFLVIVILSQGKSDEEDIDQIMMDYQQEQLKSQQGVLLNEQSRIEDRFDNLKFTPQEEVETTLLTQSKEDIVVEDYPKEMFLKTRLSEPYSDLYMKKNSMVMGSMKDGCDYQIPEKGISRMHAKIMKKEDGLYLLDMNSTNGTYVNGELIESGREYPLEEGDEISLARTVAFVVAKREMIDR